ncbi:MFS transporter [Amycolatopsis sp. NPDC051045]|uniref:MFS transporter n=1 Tax=Amycolatopsis sp. NPDC051045 TaxID=3156922 RepID=UPI003426BFE9
MALKLWPPTPRNEPAEHLPALPWRQLAAPCLVTLFGGIVFYALIVELSFVLTDVGITSTGTIALISAVMSLGTAAGAIAFGRWSAKTPRALLPAEFGLAAAGLLLVFATTSPAIITVGAVFTGFGTGMLLPTLVTWAVSRLSFEQRGRGTGRWTGALFIGEFAAPLALAAIGSGTGGIRGALAVLGLASAVMGVLTALVLRRGDRPLDGSEPAPEPASVRE